MQLRFLEFAEYAAFTEDKKVIMSGIFNTIEASQNPLMPPGSQEFLILPASFLVWMVDASIGEGLTHSIKLRIRDDDGDLVLETDLGQMVFFLNPQGRPMRFQGRLVTGGLPLPGPGEYVFELIASGNKLGETTLYVDVRSAPPAT